jgi:hypothetical protein
MRRFIGYTLPGSAALRSGFGKITAPAKRPG